MKLNLPLVAATVLIVLAGAVFFTALTKAQNQKNVVVAKTDIPAYTVMTNTDVVFKPVAAGSITNEDITESEWKSRKIKFEQENPGQDFGLIATVGILRDQRVDEREVSGKDAESFSVVSPDERIVAVTSDLPGVAIGTIRAGDVVDVTQSGAGGSGSGGTAQYAKVVCLSVTAAGCQKVLPAGILLSISDQQQGGAGGTATETSRVYVLLAVAQADSNDIAGRQVSLTLNPFCRVDSEGLFVSTRQSVPCQVPGDRQASGQSGSDSATEEPATTDAPTEDADAPAETTQTTP